MDNRFQEANTLIDTAQPLLELRRNRAAIADLQRALRIARADGLKSIEERALRGLGSALKAQPAVASRYFAAALELARATGEIAEQSYALRALGDLDYRQGRSAQAQARDETALALVRRAADRDGEAATLAQLARDVAATGSLESAKGYIDAALGIIETQRRQISDPSLRTSYFASMRAYPDAEIDILMRLDRRFPDAGYSRAALAAAERVRARSLQDMFAERSIELSRTVPPELAAAQRAAVEQLNVAAFELARAEAITGDGRQALVDAVDAASHDLDEIRGRIRSANPRYADLLQPRPLDIGELQRRLLAADGAVLEYWLGSRESYLWIVTPTSFRALRLAPRARLDRLANRLAVRLRTPVQSGDGTGFAGMVAAEGRASARTRAAAAALAQALRSRDALRGLPHKLAIIADGPLEQIPFGVLPVGRGTSAWASTHDLAYLPSITTLDFLRKRSDNGAYPAAPRLAVFAAPVLQPSPGYLGAQRPPAESQRRAPPALPYARAEALSISALLPKDRVWLALGPDASRANVVATDWRRYSIVHFATHAGVDLQRPQLSGILLSVDGADGRPQDGMLRMNDIYDLDMPVDLVVLSGCDTALGRSLESEGVFSLSRAFFYAGARRVIASLWPVDDRATAAFMAEFYRALLVDHRPAGAALRSAQQRLARENRWASPYYWGGFVLQGDWD
jgi:hypothetical protein